MEDLTSFDLGRFYPHPPERVWQALISRKFILADWPLELHMPKVETGHAFSFKTYPILGTEFSGNADCEFLDVQPGRVMTFHLRFTGPRPWASTAAWTLHEEGKGTRLVYTQSGFDPDSPEHARIRAVLRGAMRTVLLRLGKILDTPD